MAILGNSPKCLKLLIENEADLNKETKEWKTPLHYAAIYGHTECMRLLLQTGKCRLGLKDITGSTALKYCCDVT